MSESELAELREQVAGLLKRVSDLEDQVAIGQLAARYGPAADYGDAEAVARLWAEDGAYDAAPHGRWEGPDGIAAMINGGHQQGIRAGMGHVLTYPHIVVDGDTARGWGYALNIRFDQAADRFYVGRMSSNQYMFRKDGGRWRIVERLNRNLDGSDEARENFRGSTECTESDR
jgi:ketosteroid isomerase-like protein